ncbi:MAG: hypothetical protein J6R83_02610 [Clostridia bacterium]|nr:hypothetical protein [Clostridia bacterium]MBO7715083.1 hypothetical protein [Methanobrevibacter sp.]
MSNLTQDFAEEVVAMFCPTTKVKITDGSDGIYLTKTNEIHCGKDWSVSGLLHEIAHAKYYLEENKTGHDGRYADILTKITDEYMSSDISYLYQDSKSKTIRGLADDFLSAHKELERTRKALDVAVDALKKLSLGNIPSLPDDETMSLAMCNYARDTLEQITAEQKDK